MEEDVELTADGSLFWNRFPNEPTLPHRNLVSPTKFLRTRGARWFDYVVLQNGRVAVGERVVDQGHANLALGLPVLAAGQVQVSAGRIIEIDNASGHYLPTGEIAREAALIAFRNENFHVPDDVYVQKAWNPVSRLWEAIDGV